MIFLKEYFLKVFVYQMFFFFYELFEILVKIFEDQYQFALVVDHLMQAI